MSTTELVGIILLLFGLFLAVTVYYVPYVRHKPAGVISGIILLVAGVALLSGAVQFQVAPAQIVGHPGVPSVAVQDLKAVSPDTYVVSTSSLSLRVDVAYNASSHLIASPTGGAVKFTFQLARTDTNTSTAIFDITSQNTMITNTSSTSPSSNADYLVQTFNNNTESMTINGASGSSPVFTLVSIPAASIVTVSVNLTLSNTAIENLYADNGASSSTAIGASASLGIIQVAGQIINMDVEITSVLS
jgi:hypothetical protein